MSRLDYYIFRTFLVSVLGSLGLLVVTLVAIDVAEKIDDFVERQVPVSALFRYYQHFIPFYANLLSPLVVFISVLFFTSKLAQRSEIVALLAGGVSFWRILRPYLLMASCFSTISWVLQLYITPKNVRRIQEFEYKYIKGRYWFDQRQVHIKLTPEGYLFIRAFDRFDKVGFGAHLERIEKGKLRERFVAEEIQWVKGKHWKFQRIWYFSEGHLPAYRFALDTILPLTPEDVIRSELYTRTMNLPELWAEYQRQKYVGGDIANLLEMELHERVAIPMASMILTALGFASASRKKRGGVAWQIGLGLLLAFVYVFLLSIAKSSLGSLSGWAWLGIWIPNIVFSAVGVVWLRWVPK
ncbi:MAG: LptF/LptG family permease [Bacteroidia bacterium]|nr:LptF/LptG family permease [Bacteroidia bacterium]MDW8133450.1 LptF/LptG family permease [Bacteroidia bacterium]